MSFLKGLTFVFFGLLIVQPGMAQDKQPALAKTNGTRIEFSGLAYMDYSYQLSAPEAEEEGENGFGYRRVYLTTDYRISDAFSGRVRFEVGDRSTTAQGRPSPFVKDLYLRWQQNGHQLFMGISPPPAFTVVERFYGYRSLDRTLMDRLRIVSSRDFGLAARGPLQSEGKVRYGVMFANNSGVRGEDDKYKRVYGQLEFYPTDKLIVTVGGDYDAGEEDVDNRSTLNAFAGYDAGSFRIGVEGFYRSVSFTNGDADTFNGISLFVAASLSENTEAIVRFDKHDRSLVEMDTYQTFLLAGVAISPHKQVRFIPNLIVLKESEEDDPSVSGRLTLHVDF